MILVAVGCQPSQPKAGGADTRLSANDLYRLHCSACHGDGSGNGPVATTLKVRPRNLRHRQWQQSVTDAHIHRTIREGGKSVKLSDQMPAFDDKLNDADVQALVLYIRHLGR